MANQASQKKIAALEARAELEIEYIQKKDQIRAVEEDPEYGMYDVRRCERALAREEAKLEKATDYSYRKPIELACQKARRNLVEAQEFQPKLKLIATENLTKELRILQRKINSHDKVHRFTDEENLEIRAVAEKEIQAAVDAKKAAKSTPRKRKASAAHKEDNVHKKTKLAATTSADSRPSTKPSDKRQGARAIKSPQKQTQADDSRKPDVSGPEPAARNNKRKASETADDEKAGHVKKARQDVRKDERPGVKEADKSFSRASSTTTSSGESSSAPSGSTSSRQAVTPATTNSPPSSLPGSSSRSAKPVQLRQVIVYCTENGKSWSWKSRPLMSDGSVGGLDILSDASAVAVCLPTSTKIDTTYALRGLTNHKSGCFLNSAVQLLSQVLSDEQILALRGGKTLSLFVSDPACLVELETNATSLSKKQVVKLQELRGAISMAAALTKSGTLEIAPYLGQLLLDMRTGGSNTENERVSPAIFQQVLAYGREAKQVGMNGARPKYEAKYQKYDGDTQEDVSEFMMDLIDILVEESDAYKFLRGVLGFTKRTLSKCEKCAKESVRDEDYTLFDLTMEDHKKTTKPVVALSAMMEKKAVVTDCNADYTCKGCNEKGSTKIATTIKDAPKFLLVNVSRVSYTNTTKDTRALAMVLDGAQFRHQDTAYTTKCFLKHSGRNPNHGHYFAFRKHNDTWYELDDSEVTAVENIQRISQDNQKQQKTGQTVVVLLQKTLQV